MELTSRNAQRQAAARASAMQNDPSQSPTIFQQKDAQMAQQAQMIQQKEMQLAQMMQQKEAQIAKKERALGIIGALMARNQPRMSGIAQLPMRPDMYTAMDGGIVFNAGGGVQRLSPGGGVRSPFEAYTKYAKLLNPLPSSTQDALTGDLDSDDIIKQLLALNELKGLKSRLAPEERKRLTEEEEARLAKQYEKYEKGMAGVDEKAVAAARGRPYSFWSGIAAGLPTDTKNLRVAEAIASLARGVASERARAQEGESRAAALLAEAERRRMERQFQEERGRPDLAKKAAIEQDALIAAANREEMDRAKFQQDTLKSAASATSKAELAKLSQEQKAAQAEQKRMLDEKSLALKAEMAGHRQEIDKGNLDLRNKLAEARIAALQDRGSAGAQAAYIQYANVYYAAMRKDPQYKDVSDEQLRVMAFEAASKTVNATRDAQARIRQDEFEQKQRNAMAEQTAKIQMSPKYLRLKREQGEAAAKRYLEEELSKTFPTSSTGGASPPTMDSDPFGIRK